MNRKVYEEAKYICDHTIGRLPMPMQDKYDTEILDIHMRCLNEVISIDEAIIEYIALTRRIMNRLIRLQFQVQELYKELAEK